MTESQSLEEQSSPKGPTFARDTLKLTMGTVIAQGLNIASAPLLTRLFGPDAFGIQAVFVSITSIIAVILCFRYEQAIVLPKNDRSAVNLLALSMLIAITISLLSIPVIWLGGDLLARWLNTPVLKNYLWLLIPSLFFGGLSMGHPALNYWTVRTRRFKEQSVSRVVGTVATIVFQLSAGFAGWISAGALVGGSVFGTVVSPLSLAWQIWRKDKKLLFDKIDWNSIRSVARRYKKFPLYSTWAALMNTISWQLPPLLLTTFFSTTISGYYAVGFRLLQLPSLFIGSAIAQVFFQRAARAKVDGNLAAVVESTFRWLVVIGLFPFLLLTFAGKDIFVIIFGETFAEAGVYAQILSVWTFFWFISSPMSTLFVVLEKQEFDFKINLAILITRFLSLWFGGLLGSARLALLFFSVSGIFVYGYLSIAIASASGVPILRLVKPILMNLAVFSPVGIALFFLQSIHAPIWLNLGLASLSGLVYLIYLYNNMPEIKDIIRATQ